MQNDIVSEQIQNDFSALLDVFIASRATLLKKHDVLLPMAMALDEYGKPQFIVLKPYDDAMQDMQTYLEEYRTMLNDQYRENTAYLLGYDITLKNNDEFTDGICCELTHITGKYIRVAVPFSKNSLTNTITLGDLVRFE